MNDLKLPSTVMVCPLCAGMGEYSQTYTAGCGLGYYRARGTCDMCRTLPLQAGSGYVYKASHKPVGASVVAQIETLNPKN